MRLRRCLLFILCLLVPAVPVFAGVFQANGIKIGEVDQNSALLWMRLTRHAEANHDGADFLVPAKMDGKGAPEPPGMVEQLPQGMTLDTMRGAVPGAAGSVRVTWSASDGREADSGWLPVDAQKDYTKHYRLERLEPGETYTLTVESRDSAGESGQTVDGTFRTAPAADRELPVTFVVTSCQDYPRRDSPAGHRIYPEMRALDPDFFVHAGDIEYYDKPDPFATNVELARFKWNRLYGLPNLSGFHCQVASYFIKDDHDTISNDCWPGVDYGELTWQQGLDLFREQFPVKQDNYRTIRWGRDLQVWLVEGRDYRSPNTQPDGPEKTIWGKEQMEWFLRTFAESDATFRVLISPTPVVGPDRSGKADNHANKGFTYEGDVIRDFLAAQRNAFVVCGDRHWQYVSVDGRTGVKEFSCGAASDRHAGGWKPDRVEPEHRYLAVQGGFLSVTVERRHGEAVLVARHHDVSGKVTNEDVNPAVQ